MTLPTHDGQARTTTLAPTKWTPPDMLGDYGGCTCKIILRKLMEAGAEHAAKMHKNPNHVWTGDDVLIHLHEEEMIIVPRLRRAGVPLHAINAILADHRWIRREVYTHGNVVSKALFEAHAKMEDAILLRYRW